MLDALASTGLYGDGRLMALSSYETACTRPRWRTAAAWSPSSTARDAGRGADSGKHAFAAELMAAEVPAVGPLVLNGRTLHPYGGFQFSVSPGAAGASRAGRLRGARMDGPFSPRASTPWAPHALSRTAPLDLQSFGTEPRDWLLEHALIPLDVQSAWRDACNIALDLIATSAQSTGVEGQFGLKTPRHCACTATATPATSSGRRWTNGDAARTSWTWTTPAWAPLCRTCGCCCRATGASAHQLGALLDGYEQFRPFDRRELALIEPLRTLRLIHYSAWLARRWEDRSSPSTSPGSAPATTGAGRWTCCTSRSRQWKKPRWWCEEPSRPLHTRGCRDTGLNTSVLLFMLQDTCPLCDVIQP